MGTYTGTNGIDEIWNGHVTAGVTSVPAGSSPSDDQDTITGLASNDLLRGQGGNDTLHGGTGDDSLYGDGPFTEHPGDDLLYGDDGNDGLYGGDGNDTIHGGTGDDDLNGETGDDTLYGDNGKDDLHGGSGNDLLNGGGGQDRLYGETGNDKLHFDSTGDSAVGENRDVIEDFQIGVDKIDVSTIDADINLAGHQAFAFIGTAPPTGPGQINIFNDTNGQTIIQLHTNNDTTPESEIAIADGSVLASAYTPSDFILETGPANNQSPEIGHAETFREGDLVFFRLSYSDPNNDAEGFGFRGINGSGWAEETHPFSNPSYGRVSPGTVEYPFNQLCSTGSPYESDVEAWIYDSAGLKSAPVSIHLACSAPSEMVTPSPDLL